MTDILDLTKETTPIGADAIYIVTGIVGKIGTDKYILLSDYFGNMPDAKFLGEVGQTLVDHETTGATETIDWTASNLHTCEVDEDCTFTFTAPTNTGHLTLIVEGDGTARSLTWPATVKWVGAGEPTWGGTDGKKNIMSMVWDGTDYIASGAKYA